MGFINADLKKKFQIVFFFRHYLISMHESDIKTDVVKKNCTLHRGKFFLVSCAAKINRPHSIDCDNLRYFIMFAET